MKYITVSIGNTDNRLTQDEWSKFVGDTNILILNYGKIHFFGGAPNWERWQNVAWLFEIEPAFISNFMSQLSELRKQYKQDSAFFMIADGMFV